MRLPLLIALMATGSGCVVVNQGEVGVMRRWGKIDDQPVQAGLVFFEPVSTQVLKVPTRLTTVTVDFTLPSKEGLNVDAQISILYRVESEKAPQVLGTIGEEYEEELLVPVFRSGAADVSARFFAKDLYSSERGRIEKEIKALMTEVLRGRGFVIEAVLMKAIALPAGLAKAIETKLSAEQDAERMQFTIQRERLEADRKRIEAEGQRDAQKIVAEGLTESVLRLRAIEAFKALSLSQNAKVIVTDGKSPLQVTGDAR
jgi:regulator of protease activity HflC (stomatin/prohibitin superfamily)